MENLKLAEQVIDVIRDKSKIMDNYSLLTMAKNLYALLLSAFDEATDLEDTFKACKLDIMYLLPLTENMVIKCTDDNDTKYLGEYYDLWKKSLAFAGRRSLEHFIDYMELDLPPNGKVLGNRRAVLKPFVYYLGKSAFDNDLEYVLASFPPSYGKTYTCNLYSAWLYGLNINNTILRLSYNQELVLTASRAVQNFVKDPKFADVFPYYAKFNGKPFEKEKESDWIIKGSNTQTSHISRTRDGGTTGVRANKAIILDDMTKGAEEATASDLHKKMFNKWTTEWLNRRTGDPITYVLIGTMWSPEDILNRVADNLAFNHEIIDDPNFKYTKIAKDGSCALIRIPLLDENDKTTCRAVMSTPAAIRLRDITDPFLFSCVYQQDPIAPSGLVFAHEQIKHFEELPKDKDGNNLCGDYSFASLDPARRGKDFVSMPICKSDGTIYYMTDCLFKMEAMSDLYDEICEKIIINRVVRLVLENNTDTSLKKVLEDELHKKGYYNCEIVEKYNVAKKEQRIKDMQGVVKNRISFLDAKKYLSNSDYGKFMRNMTTYSFDFPAKHDDAPDSIAMFAKEIILNGGSPNRPKGLDRRLLGI